MILYELTNTDAIEATREETWEKAQQHWEEASKAIWQESREATWKEDRQQVIDLINQGLTGEQLKQTLLREPPRVVPQTTKTEGTK